MPRLKLGDSAPPFELPGIDGRTTRSPTTTACRWQSSSRASTAPTSSPGRIGINEVARDYDGRAGLVAINSNDHAGDGIESMAARAQEKSFVFPFLRDESQAVADAYQPARTPEVFLFDSDRRLVYHGAPDSTTHDPAGATPFLRQALDAVLAGEAPAVQETPAVGCTIKWRS